MMKHYLRIASVAALAFCLGSPPALGGQADAPDYAGVVDRLLDDGDRCAVLVAVDGKVLFERGYGYLRPGGKKPVTPESLFDLGSLSKHFTAAAVLKLAESNKLDLDAPISRIVSAPASCEGVTLRQILGHTAGFPAAISLSDRADSDRRQAIREILDSRKDIPPGTHFEYSNTGYELAAALVEEVAGKSLQSFLSKELFRRAKLRNTTSVGGKAPSHKLATRRISGPRESDLEAFPSGWGRRGATGVLSSVEDLMRWDEALRSGKVLKKESRDAWATPGNGGYGLGWRVEDDPSLGRRLSHGGSVEGYRSWMARWIKQGAVIVVLGDEGVDAEAIGIALEKELYPARSRTQVHAEERVAFVPSFMQGPRGNWHFEHEYEWVWNASEEEELELYAFAPANGGSGGPPVVEGIYLSARTGRILSRRLHRALAKLGETDEVILTSTITWEEPPDSDSLWLMIESVKSYVSHPKPGATSLRFGFRNQDGVQLELEISTPCLRRYLGALDIALGELE